MAKKDLRLFTIEWSADPYESYLSVVEAEDDAHALEVLKENRSTARTSRYDFETHELCPRGKPGIIYERFTGE